MRIAMLKNTKPFLRNAGRVAIAAGLLATVLAALMIAKKQFASASEINSIVANDLQDAIGI